MLAVIAVFLFYLCFWICVRGLTNNYRDQSDYFKEFQIYISYIYNPNFKIYCLDR